MSRIFPSSFCRTRADSGLEAKLSKSAKGRIASLKASSESSLARKTLPQLLTARSFSSFWDGYIGSRLFAQLHASPGDRAHRPWTGALCGRHAGRQVVRRIGNIYARLKGQGDRQADVICYTSAT